MYEFENGDYCSWSWEAVLNETQMCGPRQPYSSLAQAQGWDLYHGLLSCRRNTSTCQFQKTLLAPLYRQALLTLSRWSSSPFSQGPMSHARAERQPVLWLQAALWSKHELGQTPPLVSSVWWVGWSWMWLTHGGVARTRRSCIAIPRHVGSTW